MVQRLPLPDISIHALREERDAASATHPIHSSDFNLRAPRGARRRHTTGFWYVTIFQSTRSARSATIRGVINMCYNKISIHALREERDRSISHAPNSFI